MSITVIEAGSAEEAIAKLTAELEAEEKFIELCNHGAGALAKPGQFMLVAVAALADEGGFYDYKERMFHGLADDEGDPTVAMQSLVVVAAGLYGKAILKANTLPDGHLHDWGFDSREELEALADAFYGKIYTPDFFVDVVENFWGAVDEITGSDAEETAYHQNAGLLGHLMRHYLVDVVGNPDEHAKQFIGKAAAHLNLFKYDCGYRG